MAGILETKTQLKRRITMIAQFKKNSYQWSPLAVFLIILLACISLPDAEGSKKSGISWPKSEPGISLRRVWSGPGVDVFGAPSPDGRYLSYTDWETGDLAIYELATGKKSHLTNEGSWDKPIEYTECSRWSPDGKQIVYDWYNENGFIELRIIGLEGSKSRILYSNEEVEWAQTHDWSPDGKQILACFSRKGGAQQIVLVSAEDGSVRVLKILDKGWPKNMNFSPDGRCIVYDFPQKENSPERDISLLSTDGSHEITLVEHPAHDFVLGWAPDGKHILITSDRTGTPDFWIIRVTEGKPQGVPKLVKSSKGPFPPVGLGFTMDGSFYYGHRPNKTDLYITEIDPETGKIMVPPHEAINRFVESNATPDYSPDGKYLAYISRRPPMTTRYTTNPIGNVLCIRSLETGEEREFRPDINRFGWPRWSPDGRSVLIVDWNANNLMGYYQINTQTGNVTPVLPRTKRGNLFGGHVWSRDGKTIFYGRRDGKDNIFQVIVRDLKSGTEKVLYRSDDKFNISLSPDGQWLALIFVSKEKPRLIVMPAAGGESRELCRFEEDDGFIFGSSCSITWTADGKYILFTMIDSKIDDPQWELCRIPTDGGELEKLGLKMSGSFFNLSVHPDGRHIAFSSREQSGSEVWVMENFLPTMPVAKLDHQAHFRKIRIPTKPQNGVLSPNGNKLAFMSDDAVWVVPLHGKVDPDIAGEPIRLAEVPGIWAASNMMAWSADGKWIAVYGGGNQSDSDEGSVVSVLPVAGGTPRVVRLPEQGGHLWSYRLSLSPDGQMLAFSALELGKPRAEVPDSHDRYIYTIPTAVGKPKQVSSRWARMPSFSPDGRLIAYVDYRKREAWKKNTRRSRFHGDLWVVPSAGGTPVKLATADGRLRGPVWSPDCKYIAAHHEPGGSNDSKEIWVYPLSPDTSSAGEPKKIALPHSSWNMLAGWTPDNELGVFISTEEQCAIYTVPASGGKAVQITLTEWPYYPRWSPDGERIYFRGAFDKEENKVPILYVPPAGGDPVQVHVRSERRLVSRVPGGGLNVSPDGKKIVFSAYQEPYNPKEGVDVWTIPLDGGLPTRLTNDESSEGYPCWSPDGEWIAFVDHHETSEKEGFYAIYVVPAVGGEARQITSRADSVGSGAIAFSRDGERIAFFSDGSIKTIPIEGGESEMLVAEVKSGRHSQLAYSPDGLKIAHNARGKIWITSLDGGEPQELSTGLPKDAKLSEFSWSPGGEKIAFFGSSGGEAEFLLIENFLPADVASTAGK
jgi:Tol biopolymer transport system component